MKPNLLIVKMDPKLLRIRKMRLMKNQKFYQKEKLKLLKSMLITSRKKRRMIALMQSPNTKK